MSGQRHRQGSRTSTASLLQRRSADRSPGSNANSQQSLRKWKLCGGLLVLPLTACLLWMHRPARVEDQRPTILRRPNVVLAEAHVDRSQHATYADSVTVDLELGSFKTTPQVEEPAIQAQAQAVPSTLEITLSTLPARADAHCSTDGDISIPEAERSAQVFQCRKKVARDLAEAACARLDTSPPQPAFARATLNTARLTYGHSGPGIAVQHDGSAGTLGSLPPSIAVAVEPTADIVSNVVLSQGVWEPHEIQAVLMALERSNATAAPQPPVLVDIGANLGVFSFVAALLGYPVLAFEAMSRNVDAIHQTLCWNPELRERITLFPYGLAEAEHACMVVADQNNVADGHLVCDDAQLQAMPEAVARGVAHSVRLGDYLEGVQADVLKIDVEGYEPQVLRGAGSALDQVQFALSEVSPVDMPKAANRTFADVGAEYIRGWDERGFSIHVCITNVGCFDQPAVSVAEAMEATRGGTTIINVLMKKKGGSVRVVTSAEPGEGVVPTRGASTIPVGV